MSIRPVDLQVMVQKSADIGKMNHNEADRTSTSYQQISDKVQKDVEHNDQMVLNANKSEHDGVDKDGKGNSSYSGKKSRRDKDSGDKKEKKQSTSIFDVSI